MTSKKESPKSESEGKAQETPKDTTHEPIDHIEITHYKLRKSARGDFRQKAKDERKKKFGKE